MLKDVMVWEYGIPKNPLSSHMCITCLVLTLCTSSLPAGWWNADPGCVLSFSREIHLKSAWQVKIVPSYSFL